MRLLADGNTAGMAAPSLAELRRRRPEILALMAEYGAHHVRVFGSVARGGQGEASDLDLLVEFHPGTGLIRWAELIVELERLLGCAVDVATESSLRSTIRERVHAEAVLL